jgi:hypothetical protein
MIFFGTMEESHCVIKDNAYTNFFIHSILLSESSKQCFKKIDFRKKMSLLVISTLGVYRFLYVRSESFFDIRYDTLVIDH